MPPGAVAVELTLERYAALITQEACISNVSKTTKAARCGDGLRCDNGVGAAFEQKWIKRRMKKLRSPETYAHFVDGVIASPNKPPACVPAIQIELH